MEFGVSVSSKTGLIKTEYVLVGGHNVMGLLRVNIIRFWVNSSLGKLENYLSRVFRPSKSLSKHIYSVLSKIIVSV